MIKNLKTPTFFTSITPPNPDGVDYWVDLTENSRGNIIKFWDENLYQWVKLTDASSEYAVAPRIGINNNWWVHNRDTGVRATGQSSYEVWSSIPGNENKTVDDYINYLREPSQTVLDEWTAVSPVINQTITDATQVITDGAQAAQWAKEQGDYAKAQGDLAANLNDEVQFLFDNKGDSLIVFDEKIYLTANGEIIGDGVQAPGGGGGTGGGGSNMRVRNLSGSSISVAVGQPVIIEYEFISTDSIDQTPTGDGSVSYIVNGITVRTESVAQGIVTKDVTQYFVAGANTLRYIVTDSYGSTRTINIKVEILNINIVSSFDVSQPLWGDFTFRYTPIGGMPKTVHFEIDGIEVATVTTELTNREMSQLLPGQSHGAHRLRVWLTAEVEGVELTSSVLTYDLMFVEPGNDAPIIASSFVPAEVTQGSTVNIPFYVYTPSPSATVTLWVNGVQSSTREVDRLLQIWTYRANVAGNITLEIRCGSTTRTFVIPVLPGEITAEAETQDLELFLTSLGKSNSDTDRNVWSYNGINTSLTNMNWVTNGWIQDDKGYTCLRIGSGAKATIPLKIFENDFPLTGKTIEFEFTVRGVYKYDVPLISCWANDRGLMITPQKVTLKSEQTELTAIYKEEERIRVAIVIQKRSANRLINVYINGINSQAVQYSANDSFVQNTPANITIGDDNAIIDIYNIRVYSNDLNKYQILDNYIADMDDMEKKLEVFKRNQIYNATGTISISALNEQLPILTIIGSLPAYKGDKKTVKVVYEDKSNPTKSFTAEGVQIDVQGTSSQYYPRKNFKLSFKNGFTMTINGSKQAKFTLNDTEVLPASVFCTKADFAESSGTHNTGLANYADWLLKRLNLLTDPQLSDPSVRTTIYGEPCAIAHKFTDTSSAEFIGKYNFNTDKGAEDTFGFEGNDESWEFLNNTSNLALFKTNNFTNWQDTLEARFPDGFTDTSKVKSVFDWIASVIAVPLQQARLNKFKAEVDQYFDVKLLQFYWLFTFIFGMVDQRAKNQFLTVYNNKLWLFILYDNDTCLGINNEGAITFDYNIEIHDIIGSKNVWNGEDSELWKLVEAAFPDEIKTMYTTMRQQGYLNYDKVTEYLVNRQSDKWSESVYNEDGYFKYELPLIDGYWDYSQSTSNPTLVKTGAYLYALQGSREMHRRYWLHNRLLYCDSKYLAGSVFSDTAVFRTYTPSVWGGIEPIADITITSFNAMYLNVKWGSVTRTARVGFNETKTMVAPTDMQFNDTETIVYGASMISSLGDLAPLYVGTVDITKATRLRELKVGDGRPGYSNNNLEHMYIGNNIMLQSIDVQNCPNLKSTLDISGCENIKTVLALGTSITSVALPAAGILETLQLPNTITNLTIKNQPYLTAGGLVLEDVSNLSTLVLENVNFDAFSLMIRCLDEGQLQRVRCLNVNGYLQNSDKLKQLRTLGGIDENGIYTDKAIITGTVHISTVANFEIPTLQTMFEGLTVTYDNVTYPAARNVYVTSANGYISGAVVTNVNNPTEVYVTNENGFFVIPHGNAITYRVDKDGYNSVQSTFVATSVEVTEVITLIPWNDLTITPSVETALGTVVAVTDWRVSFDDSPFVNVFGPSYTVKHRSGSVTISAECDIDGITYKHQVVTYVNSGIPTAVSFVLTASWQDIMPEENGDIIIDYAYTDSALTTRRRIGIISSVQGDQYEIHCWDGTILTPAIDVLAGIEYIYELPVATATTLRRFRIKNCQNITNLTFGGTLAIRSMWSVGNSQVKNLTFKNHSGLEYVGPNIFKNDVGRTNIDELFYYTALKDIPDTLFHYFISATTAKSAFSGIKSLKTFPENFFDRCANLVYFDSMCYNCLNFEKVPNSLFASVSPGLVRSARSMFSDCRKLSELHLRPFKNKGIWTLTTLYQYIRYEVPEGSVIVDNFFEDVTVNNCNGMFNNSEIAKIGKNFTKGLKSNLVNGPISGTGLFAAVKKLIEVPEDMFKDALTPLDGIVANAFTYGSVEIVPPTFFNHVDCAWNSTFHACQIKKLPDNLFINAPSKTYYRVFAENGNLTEAPRNMFGLNTAKGQPYLVTHMFNTCHQLTTIPDDVFGNAANCESISYCFSSCAIKTIGLIFETFSSCVDYGSVFLRNPLESVPSGLFKLINMPTGTQRFSYALEETAISELPEGLFVEPQVTTDARTAIELTCICRGCVNLTHVDLNFIKFDPLRAPSLDDVVYMGAPFSNSGLKRFTITNVDRKRITEWSNIFQSTKMLEDVPEDMLVDTIAPAPRLNNFFYAAGGENFSGSTIRLPENMTSGVNISYSFQFNSVVTGVKIIVSQTTPVPNMQSSAFVASNLDGIYVPDESVAAYKSATTWISWADIIKPMSTYVP